MTAKVLTIGEIVVEMMAAERGTGFSERLSWSGPFASGAPAIFIDQVARMGQPCAIVSSVGDDDFGHLNLARLERDGVDTSGVSVLDREVTPTAFVRYRADGGRDFHFNLGHSAYRRFEWRDGAEMLLGRCAHLHISGSSLVVPGAADAIRRAASDIRGRRGTVSLDPNIRPELARDPSIAGHLRALLAVCDFVLPSAGEVTALTESDDEQDAIAELLERGIRAVVVKRGTEGSSYHDRTGRIHAPAFPAMEVDPTGAGDCFDAAFVTSMLQGRGREASLRLANAAGALAVQSLGPMEGTSTLGQLEDLVRRSQRSRQTTSASTEVRPVAPGSRLKSLLESYDDSSGVSGLASVCSAHEIVLEAALLQARDEAAPVLIEATCNQVNHVGGYTGLTPAQFRDVVYGIADRVGYPRHRVVLGGDHLGPNPWRHLSAPRALEEAERMVAAYASAGFAKIHLDTSMGCAGEAGHLDDAVTAERAAHLAAICEASVPDGGRRPVYVIGTEVPTPGGLQSTTEEVHVSTPEAVLATLDAHRKSFVAAGAVQAFDRVLAIVAHPGVEFDNEKVFVYEPDRAKELSGLLPQLGGMVFEGHSTDYQPAAALAALVEDGFRVLKVGPWLTFAMREALYALDDAAKWLVQGWPDRSLASCLEREMLDNPRHWKRYYSGDEPTQKLLRHFSYSDRARYYWSAPAVLEALGALFDVLGDRPLPPGVLSQCLPEMRDRVGAGIVSNHPRALVIEMVRDVLRRYSGACGRGAITA